MLSTKGHAANVERALNRRCDSCTRTTDECGKSATWWRYFSALHCAMCRNLNSPASLVAKQRRMCEPHCGALLERGVQMEGALRLLRVLPCQTDVQCTQQTTQNKRAQQNGAPQVASPLAFSKMTSHTTNTHTSTTGKAEVEETTVRHDLLQKTIAASSNSDVQPLKTIFNCTYSQKWCRWQLYE